MRKELEKTYDPKDIEDRLYEKWMEKGSCLRTSHHWWNLCLEDNFMKNGWRKDTFMRR